MGSIKPEAASVLPKFGKVVLTLENVLLPAEKLEPSPSRADGLDSETEFNLRSMGCEMIQISGTLLRLPQVAMACGQVLFQRLYYAKSLVRYPMEATAMACVVLASKIEEAPRKIRDIINVFRHIRQARSGKPISPVVLDSNYIALKNQVIKAERRLLKELGFCCHVKHPHKMIIMYLQLVDCHQDRDMAQWSWNYMNDALRTDVSVRFTPESIACASIWLAARELRVPLPEEPAWYEVVKVKLDDIHHIAASILKLYNREKVTLEQLETKVEEIRREQQNAKLNKSASNASAMQQQTPLQTTTKFSPTHHQSPERKRPKSSSDSDESSAERRRGRSYSRSRSPRGRSPYRGRRDRKSPSVSPQVTPPPRFSKNKDKVPVVRSRSRSRSRSPLRTYDKYTTRSDKYPRHEKSSKTTSNRSEPERSRSAKRNRSEYDDKYEREEKERNGDAGKDRKPVKKYDNGYDKEVSRYEKHDKRERSDKPEKYERSEKVDKYDRHDKVDRHEKISKYEKDDKYEKLAKYDKDEKYDKVEKLDKYVKYDKPEKYEKISKHDKYEKYDKSSSRKSKKSSRSNDRKK